MSKGEMMLRWYARFGHVLPQAIERQNLLSLYQRIIELKNK